MSDMIICSKQEECPLLLAAVEAKVKAESELRLWNSTCWNPQKELQDLRKAHEELRANSNKLFKLADSARAKQVLYFATSPANYDEKHRALVACRAAEHDLDKFLTELKLAAAERKRQSQPDLFQGQ